MSVGSWDELKFYLTKTIDEIKSDLHYIRKEQLDTREKLTNVSAQLQGLDIIKTDLHVVQEKVTIIQTKLLVGVAIVGVVASAIVQWLGRLF
jgi:hypothetical protein